MQMRGSVFPTPQIVHRNDNILKVYLDISLNSNDHVHETHIFKCPGWVDTGPDFAFAIHANKAIHNIPNVVVAVLPEEEGFQVEATDGLVLIEQLDWWYFVHLPPLEKAILAG